MAENFQFPFQCIEIAKAKNGSSRNVLVTAAGSKLYSYAAETGQRLAVWPTDASTSDEADITRSSGAETNTRDQAPPEKKRKVDPSSEHTLSRTSGKNASWSTIPILTSTSTGEYVVALTAEDKCIRVFQISEDGIFHQLSSRTMPKRPCAITFTSDDTTIISGDKFGDVYSLPLIPGDEPRYVPKTKQAGPRGPSATSLTVHTQRNLKSLEMQKQVQALKAKAEPIPTEDEPTFEHELLLGHVSLLTALALVSLPAKDPSSTKKHTYILTADRDEHIRVSRGPPQAHVIENYCFGHNSFISQLCIPHWAPEFLVSGGGDDSLFVWKWVDGQILHKVSLLGQTQESKQVAVRGIWASSFSPDSSSQHRYILVALEGSPHLLYYTLEVDGALKPQGSIQVSGNVLDVRSIEERSTVIISVDCIREPGSTQEWRSNPPSSPTLIEEFRLKSGTENPEWEPVSDSMTRAINTTGTSSVPANLNGKQKEEMNSSEYGLENLRKKKYDFDE